MTPEQRRLRDSLEKSLRHASSGSHDSDQGHPRRDRDLERRIATHLAEVLTGEPTLASAELVALEAAEPDLGRRVRRALHGHLLGPAAIPREHLPFYLPWLEASEQAVATRGREWLQDLSPRLEGPQVIAARGTDGEGAKGETSRILEKLLTAWGYIRRHAPAAGPKSDTAPLHTEGAAQELAAPEEAPATWKGFQGLGPLPFLTAALETLGEDPQAFGFLLRYGTYAPDERRSQFRVGGVGMAELSERLTEWIEGQGASKFPIQVVDDGSGELTIHLLE